LIQELHPYGEYQKKWVSSANGMVPEEEENILNWWCAFLQQAR
jgi:hypothetical protein